VLKHINNFEISENIKFGDPLFAGNQVYFNDRIFNLNEILSIKKIPSNDYSINDHLNFIESYIPKGLISKSNYYKIKNITKNFSGGISSFYGFESKLDSNDSKSDYLFAVSSKNGERDKLKYVLSNLPNKIIENDEWKKIKKFVDCWTDPTSILHDKILGLWFEFDTSEIDDINQIPSLFFQTKFKKRNKSNYIKDNLWIINQAIPILSGAKVKINVKSKFIEIIKKLPEKSSIFHVAYMLSRENNDIRIVINEIIPDQIVPYLKSIGWNKNDFELEKIVNKIKKYSNCIRLHISINSKLNQKIGLECFISPNEYYNLNQWNEFLDFLIEKGWCKTELKNPLLNFAGINIEDKFDEFNFNDYMPSVKLSDNYYQKALVRYISHVKLIYEPINKVKVKAYTGVRLFGKKSSDII
jgi:hypothetical protein